MKHISLSEGFLCKVIRSNHWEEAFLAEFHNGGWRLVELGGTWESVYSDKGLEYVPIEDVTHWKYFDDDEMEYQVYEAF